MVSILDVICPATSLRRQQAGNRQEGNVALRVEVKGKMRRNIMFTWSIWYLKLCTICRVNWSLWFNVVYEMLFCQHSWGCMSCSLLQWSSIEPLLLVCRVLGTSTHDMATESGQPHRYCDSHGAALKLVKCHLMEVETCWSSHTKCILCVSVIWLSRVVGLVCSSQRVPSRHAVQFGVGCRNGLCQGQRRDTSSSACLLAAAL